jgi:hypothetical protein
VTAYAERAAVIEALERRLIASRQHSEEVRARHELVQRQINLAVQIYIDAITAPWRALAEELRR